MAVWETEDESPGPAGSLPTPADTPYRTPSRNVSRASRKSRRSVTPPGKSGKSSSPPPLPGDRSERGSKRSSRDVTNDDTISILDPRRFTPTLHANLVSEILALRRDQEEKLKIIESLETSLHSSREETETLQATLVSTGKESRSLKRQLALLEGGTSSALGELARERDEAVESANETKRRLEASQKKVRSQEEDSERVHRQWAKEKDEWEEEKRKFERRIHVAETRLKVVLDEVAAFQAAQAAGFQDGPESEVEESAKENDAASVRTMSMTNSIRFSVMNGAPKTNGNSLADELGFDGGYDDESDYGGRESVLSNGAHGGHMRNMSRDSLFSRTHMRRQSNESLMRSGSVARRLHLNHSALEKLEDAVIREDDETQPPPPPKAMYVDTGIQFSPPPSPKIVPVKPSTPEPHLTALRIERLYDVDSPPRADSEIEANQRRKRVHIGQPLTLRQVNVGNYMVNGSSQTAEEPLSPPKTPKSPFQELPPTPKLKQSAMVSASTQTDIPPPLQPTFVLPPMPPIPSISIIPPTSRPTTPREPRLPQLSKDFGCQVSILSSAPMQSTAVQTEEIRVDKRLDKLPAHLHPSAVTSRPTSPAIPPVETLPEDTRQFTPIPGNVPPRNPRRLTSKRSITEMPSSPPIASSSIVETEETHDAYPGNNDDGPLSNQKAPMRRPHRISSLFAGFDGGSSDEVDEFLDADMSDSEYRTALSAPKPTKSGAGRASKRGSGGTATSDLMSSHRWSGGRYSGRASEETDGFGSANVYPSRESRDSGFSRTGSKRGARSSILGMKSSGMRKAAMIQSGIASHQRARSPSLTDPKEPPFPIPTRASSRKPPVSVSAPSEGRTSPSGGGGWHRRGGSRSHYRANSIRKVRSAAALPRNHKYRRQSSRSPPPFSPSTEAPESPGLPPLPTNDITTPRNRDSYTYSKYKTHQPQLSTNTANTGDTGVGSLASSNQATSVVDAIAQTMVGEWMFKYVRRRKSFGVADGKAGDDSSNDRHKRWVWLAPYERAILWSSKQPVSGSALLGKAGRKLTIQSVLDVKDDNPPPKGAGAVFNRSILILTPQRALKFTALNAERHYVWLTSLSFLAHSHQAIPESLVSPPPKPLPEEYELPKAKVRRPGIRDSIRLTKSKTAVIKSDPPMPPMSVASSQTDSVAPNVPSYRHAMPELPEPYTLPTHARDLSRDAAEPPFIPRFHERANQALVHGRKRSNTGGHVPPPLSFRGFSGPASSYHHAATNSTAGNSIGTAGSSDIYSNGGASSGMGSSGVTWATGSVRTSEASSRPSGPVMNNFFDAIGTVRMEAFISPLAFSRIEDTPYEQDEFRRVARRRSKELRRRASRSRQRDSYHSKGTRGTDDLDDWFLRDDPFRGF
ncbi:hypothetical protein QBC47DRAFT_119627 [Echria macrotheca]|uniref:Pleckstrin homology domain-containing protein n=1 Tax=Echria macrotheca TaxID=438768 RepID=A0AAJ0F6X4_9PEZI|nr:hypothetical protein QBC47DRAFT_119627 [Echria macrotheca]